MDVVIFQQLVVSLGLGLLLGLERERRGPSIAGIRTFPIISLFGTVCAQVGEVFGGWVVAAGLLALTAVIVPANFIQRKSGNVDPGTTTEIAALLLYVVGALIAIGYFAAALVVAGVLAVLLHSKKPLHNFARAVGERDMRAIMLFVLLSLVILPILPNRDFGPYSVWNPFKLWLMVVLIVGISLGGYIAYKLFGARAGALLGGVIGGMVSSTATTVSYARRAGSEEALASLGAFVIMTASCVSVVRVLVEIAAIAPLHFGDIAWPLITMLAACVAIAAVLYFPSRNQATKMPEQKNPAELKPALIFGTLYAGVLLAAAVAKQHFGSAGLYIVAMISGLTDLDAITLSTAQLANSKQVEATVAWHVILIAVLSNLVFKFGIVAALGSARLTKRVGMAFGAALLAGLGILLLWPA
ncbi:MAG TPA: MgtC/SapB family protein [Terrimicrobiaceae bacterium]|nr:MgtC/SapB family protein [Terrimicrobiaceae bacterium]